MADKLISILGSIVILAMLTTLVLPGRGTAGVISAGGGAFVGSIRAAMGR